MGEEIISAIAFALRGLSSYLVGRAEHKNGLKQNTALADVPGIAVITISGFLRVLRLPWIFLSYAVDIFVEQE
ncbi:MAG: hypothetical protein FWG81_11770 [Betaproteobacteria bacterium]|nr:hypothetical protein [Betaproteobacteria bacterium]